ncbi:uncharacterized protein C9orf152-like [Spea bombifrons]|uniref:uncharacterized protein C9orf152-like n=1 Tax=Spea bombifrons TaxID=233779 RepID=UPI002349613F|nr:uncharacterized protein C9orf152-like [Spea bombifrons]
MAGCCSCWENVPVWKQAVKAYKYMSAILSVTHTSTDPADDTRKPSKMDIHQLEEQYFCIKRKRREQPHMIVFKAGENELVSGEPLVNTVPVNGPIKKPKPFNEEMPAADVTLESQNKNYTTSGNESWHTHLNMHRMVQLEGHFALENGPKEKEKKMNFDDKSVQFNRLLSFEKFPSDKGLHNTERRSSGSSRENNDLYRKSSLKHPIPAHYHFPALKGTSHGDKDFYYPFPQRKNPRISETARKLGLYVTH